LDTSFLSLLLLAWIEVVVVVVDELHLLRPMIAFDDYFSTDRSVLQTAHHHSPVHNKWIDWVSMDRISQFPLAMCSVDWRGIILVEAIR